VPWERPQTHRSSPSPPASSHSQQALRGQRAVFCASSLLIYSLRLRKIIPVRSACEFQRGKREKKNVPASGRPLADERVTRCECAELAPSLPPRPREHCDSWYHLWLLTEKRVLLASDPWRY